MKYTNDIIKEIFECKDLGYYAANHINIWDYNKNIFKKPSDDVLLMCELIQNHDKLIIETSRGKGKTLAGVIAAQHYARVEWDRTYMYVSNITNSALDAKQTFDILSGTGIPTWQINDITDISRTKVDFSTNNRLIFHSAAAGVFRGLALSFIIMDDIDFWRDSRQEQFLEYIGCMMIPKVVIFATMSGNDTPFKEFLSKPPKGFTHVVL